jgi:uncharacterized membrane protein
MEQQDTHLIIATFDGEHDAERALDVLKESRDEKMIGIQAAVVLQKDEQEQVHFKDVGMTPAKGAAGGAVLGVVVGVLTGGTGLALGAIGALVGGLVGRKKRDSSSPTARLNQAAASLRPGSSAVVIVMEEGWVVVVEKELETMGAEVMTTVISSDVVRQAEDHQDLALEALSQELK